MSKHTFHIPVMGIGFTIDTPLKVSQFGIDSVISLVDDILLEKLRKMYCGKHEIHYDEITDKIEDFRAKRITAYLNLVNELAKQKFEELKTAAVEKGDAIRAYFSMLPNAASLMEEFEKLSVVDIGNWIKEHLHMGSIDVNIMTKLDKENYIKDEKLPSEYNDAHAALRGYAMSDLESSIILSAGMSPRLYGYIENFEDFFPDENGKIKKKIVLKVSDYRSALIQGRFLAKKGLWVSEYRIESGLNCGGHAFATDGYLMGPILSEFRDKRDELIESVSEVLMQSLSNANRQVPKSFLPLKITAQGGVGTAEEHQFLIESYGVDAVGWGTPFLLVPEVTNLDKPTRSRLVAAEEKDLYLSRISPLGVPFNSLRGNTKDLEKEALIEKNRPGSSCPKKYLVSNKEFTDKAICAASRQYQHLKLKELDADVTANGSYGKRFERIVEKSCLCVGLGTSALLVNDLSTRTEGPGVSVCPGPNMAYFSKVMSLKEITDHIYSRINVITRTDRPNMFIKELNIYLDYLKNLIEETSADVTAKQKKYLHSFSSNLNDGINYYVELFEGVRGAFEDTKATILNELDNSRRVLGSLERRIENLAIEPVLVH